MPDRGFFLTRQAIVRQLAALSHDLYLVRLIHQATRQAFPGERLWTAAQLSTEAVIRFLRLRNREGCDVYLQPYAQDRNAGYVLLDLDATPPLVLETLRRDGLEPCVVVQTSPGHLQAWLHFSQDPLPPAVATAVAQQLAHSYGGDLASADWRHLGRLAGFTNQKPARRTPCGYAPWVQVVYAQAGLASRAQHWLRSAAASLTAPRSCAPIRHGCPDSDPAVSITPSQAARLYQQCVRRWHIAERFPQPDWSIVDLWVARDLLTQGATPNQMRAILAGGSPHFPRRHGHPQDYLQRTLDRAAFPRCASPAPVCDLPTIRPAPHAALPPAGHAAES
jgi:hypothetical protein